MSTMPKPRREGWIIPWLAHMHPWLLTVAGIILFAPLGDDFVGQLTIYLGAGIYASTLVAHLRHAYSYLCPRCARATPLDGSAAAASRRRSLAFFHWINERPQGPVIALACLVLFLAPAGIDLVFGHRSWPHFLTMAVWAYWIIESFVYLRHLPVEPWCPQCHWGDGGDEEESPIIPDPVAPSVTS